MNLLRDLLTSSPCRADGALGCFERDVHRMEAVEAVQERSGTLLRAALFMPCSERSCYLDNLGHPPSQEESQLSSGTATVNATQSSRNIAISQETRAQKSNQAHVTRLNRAQPQDI